MHREKAFADATLYEAQRIAEADTFYLSDGFLELLAVEAVTSKTTIVYGDDIPDMIGAAAAGHAAAAQQPQQQL